jgi:hypothetical protein
VAFWKIVEVVFTNVIRPVVDFTTGSAACDRGADGGNQQTGERKMEILTGASLLLWVNAAG